MATGIVMEVRSAEGVVYFREKTDALKGSLKTIDIFTREKVPPVIGAHILVGDGNGSVFARFICESEEEGWKWGTV